MYAVYQNYALDEESPLSMQAFYAYKDDAKRDQLERRQRFYGKRGKI